MSEQDFTEPGFKPFDVVLRCEWNNRQLVVNEYLGKPHEKERDYIASKVTIVPEPIDNPELAKITVKYTKIQDNSLSTLPDSPPPA